LNIRTESFSDKTRRIR